MFVFVFYGVFVGFYQTDVSDGWRRRDVFFFLSRGGVCTEYDRQGRGGAYRLSLVTAEGGVSVQPPISCLPEKIIKK